MAKQRKPTKRAGKAASKGVRDKGSVKKGKKPSDSPLPKRAPKPKKKKGK